MNSAGIFEASPTGNNEDSASFITTCSSTLAGRTVFSRSCSQKEEGATIISFLRRPLGRVATLRNPLSALYFQAVFTRIATTTIVVTVSISFSLSPFFLALFSPLCSLSSESRTRRRARTRARSCSCKSYPILLQLYVELLFSDARSRRLSGTRLLGFFHVLILLLLRRRTADSSFSVLVR